MARDWLERLQNQARADNFPLRDGSAQPDESFEPESLL
jgi:hypothetical protein